MRRFHVRASGRRSRHQTGLFLPLQIAMQEHSLSDPAGNRRSARQAAIRAPNDREDHRPACHLQI